MAFVEFSTSGSIQVNCSDMLQQGTVSTRVNIIQPETGTVVSGITVSGNTNFTLSGLHTSLDDYIMSSNAFGYLGESRFVSGLSPTTEVLDYDFQDTTISGGTLILSRDFEDASISGFSYTAVNSGVMTSSGIIASGTIEGSYYFGLAATSIASLTVVPTGTLTSGITCGRMSFLARPGTATAASNSAVGFAFMRQGSAATSNCYKITVETTATSDLYDIVLTAGQMTNGTANITSSISSPIIIGGTAEPSKDSAIIDFTSTTQRSNNRNMWIGVEWEAMSSGTLFRIYQKQYVSGDTLTTFKENAIMLSEVFWTGTTIGANLYTTTTENVAWLLGSASASTGIVGIDMLHIETLSNLSQTGINKLSVLQTNTAVAAGSTRALLERRLAYRFTAPPEGIPYLNLKIPNISSLNGFNTADLSGYSGIELFRQGGAAGDDCFAALQFRETAASGIKKGSFRSGIRLAGDTSSRVGTKFGFVFLRQGSLINSNAYTVELFISALDTYQIRIRKGTVYDSAFGDNSDFNGTILATSSSLTFNTDFDTSGGYFWIEIRWEVTGSNTTKIECLLISMPAIDGRFYSIDTSPGNVDYSLVQRLTYEDTTGPYITTADSPLVILRSRADAPFTARSNIYKLELRKSKIGN